MDPLSAVLPGMVSMGSLTAGVFFLRFWRDTRDRLFLAFGVAFTVEGLNRVALALTPDPSEAQGRKDGATPRMASTVEPP